MAVKVSIIVVVHNDESNLKNALDSIKNQTLKDIEVIVIDADSTDGSQKIIESYLSDSRFVYDKIDTYSFSLARNMGIEMAKGKYISFGDASVVYTENLFEDMYECAEKEEAQLCVSPMASSDIYGKHQFASTGKLARRKKTSKFDTDLIWNPAVTNKLFLKSKIEELDLKFNAFGKAREAAFTLPFAFESDVIVCSSKGAASYIIPVTDNGVSEFPVEHYLEAYDFIIARAETAFEKAIKNSVSDFDAKELKKVRTCYIDEVYLKEITVLLYSYYRHFWSISEEDIIKYTNIVNGLIEKLSGRGKKTLLDMNKDIFFGESLIDNKAKMTESPKVTVCVGKSEKHGHLHEKRLRIQIESIFNQTMPCFELIVDKRLKNIFPEEYMNMPNIKFIGGDSLGDFKDNALKECRTEFVMFHDGFVRLNPKILMRHYNALVNGEKFGFTTSPITKFDGAKTEKYSFSDLVFYSDMKRTRVTDGNTMFALDLFFCNKLFRKSHLEGIRFTFSDNPVLDMYKLYKHSSFKKLRHRGSYLPYTEEETLSVLKEQQGILPSDCGKLYKNYKSVYRSVITTQRYKNRTVNFLKRVKRKIIDLLSKIAVLIFTNMKIQDRVFFYTIRSDGKLLENIRYVYDKCDCKKVVFAKMLPHGKKHIFKVKYYMLTSKVIVTDDYLKYLRTVRLREGQKVVQLWHASGAFKRFGLDAPSRLTRIEEFNTHSQYSDVCVSSEYVRQFYAHAFGIDMETVKALGSPRTDALLDKEKQKLDKEELITRHPLLRDKKVYVYLPTFREKDGVVTHFNPEIDWEKLNDELSDDEVFIIGRHPVMKKEFFKDAFYSRLKDYTFEPTPLLLAVADVVITDYSSVIFDASLLDKPVLFYCPDYDSYEREFYLDYEKDLPGEMIKDSESLLLKARETFLNGSDNEIMKLFKEKEVGSCDGHSTERVAKLIMDYLK